MAFTPPGCTRERVYRYVRKCLLEGRPPTVRDVQSAMGFRAVQSAMLHLDRLVEEGRLVRARGKARGYRLPAGVHPRGTVLVPVFRRLGSPPQFLERRPIEPEDDGPEP